MRGPYAFMHNGDLGGFAAVRRPLLESLSQAAFDGIEGSTDSEHLFALFLDHIGTVHGPIGPTQLADSVRRTIEQADELVARYAPGQFNYLNLAVSDGHRAVVTRYTNEPGQKGESLHVNSGRRYLCEGGVCRMLAPELDKGAVLVSSEALSQDPGWETVGHNQMVVIDADRSVHTRAI